MSSRPSHWYDHTPAPMIDVCLARDVLQASEPPLTNPLGDELILICGSCGHHCHAFHEEFTGDSSSLRETYCPNCLTACFRDTLVVASYHFAKEIGEEQRHRYLLNRADERAWTGDVGYLDVPGAAHAVEDPPVPEEGVQMLLKDCGLEWSNSCPACGRASSEAELDFHHWDYQSDVGCQLCRKCHKHIHNDRSAAEQSDATGREWQFEAVRRLLELSQDHGLEFSGAQEFKQRYNTPRDTVTDDAVVEAFDEGSRGDRA